jgi:hypothetical protein
MARNPALDHAREHGGEIRSTVNLLEQKASVAHTGGRTVVLNDRPRHANSKYSLGLELLAKNARLARESFESAAGENPDAHYQLARLALAKQRPDDPAWGALGARAKEHLLAASEMGHVEATYRLSVLLRGEVTDPSSVEKTSVELLEEAAELDHAHSQFLLGTPRYLTACRRTE